MKQLLLLLSIFWCFSLQAQTVARVYEIQGNAFVFGARKSSKQLFQGSKINDYSEVMVEDGSALTLITDEGDKLYVNGGSLLSFYQGMPELKTGAVWVESSRKRLAGRWYTVNSIARYGEGQFIVYYDNVKAKTQLLVFSGDVYLSNTLEPNLIIDVPGGHFSVVDQSYENGLPRAPTKVGAESYHKFKNLFAGFSGLKEMNMQQLLASTGSVKHNLPREIASVNDQFPRQGNAQASKRKPVRIKTVIKHRKPASTGMKPKSLKHKKSSVPVYFHGFPKNIQNKSSSKKSVAQTKVKVAKSVVGPEEKRANPLLGRAPASLEKVKLLREIEGNTPFESSLKEATNATPRHPKEVDSLIDELKSFKQDYRKNY